MLQTLLIVTAVAIAATIAMLAVGLFFRDLLSKPEGEEKKRLELIPVEPQYGALDQWFVRLVEESGLAINVSAMMLIVVACGLLAAGIPLIIFENFIGAAVGLVAGMLVPVGFVAAVRWRRISVMRKVMPETLQIVADAVRGGHTLEEACGFVVREASGPIRDEFDQARRQFQLGHTPTAILDRLVRRIPISDFRIFATAVMVHRRAGGNLAALTERLSHTARERQEIRGHLMAVTAGSRLSAFGMVVGSFIGLSVLAYLEPEYLSAFFTHKLGPTLLIVAASLQVLGLIWVWRVLRVNY